MAERMADTLVDPLAVLLAEDVVVLMGDYLAGRMVECSVAKSVYNTVVEKGKMLADLKDKC